MYILFVALFLHCCVRIIELLLQYQINHFILFISARINDVLCTFRKLHSFVKLALLNCYCLSLYGFIYLLRMYVKTGMCGIKRACADSA